MTTRVPSASFRIDSASALSATTSGQSAAAAGRPERIDASFSSDRPARPIFSPIGEWPARYSATSRPVNPVAPKSVMSSGRSSATGCDPTDSRAAPKLGGVRRGRAGHVLRDLAGLQAARTDVLAPRRAVDLDPDLLQVRVEAALRGDHGVAPAVAERRALLAAVTDLCHGG